MTRDRDRDEDRSSADRAHHDGNSGENGEEHHGDRDLGGGLGSDDDGGPATGGEHHGDNGRPGDSDQGHGSGTAGGDQVSGKDGQGDSTPPTGSTGEDNTTPGSHASGGDTGHSGGSSGGSQDSDSGSPASTDQDGTDAKPAPEHSNGHPQSGDGRAAPTAQEHVAAPSHDERAAAGTAPGPEMSKAERGTASPEKGAAEAALPTGAGGRTATDDRAAEDSARVGADAVFAQAGGNAILPAEAAAAFSVTSLVPNAAELLSAYLPVDQEGIAAAMDRVLARIDDLGGQLIAPAEGMSLSPYLLSAIGAIAVYQIALRIRKPGAPVAGIQLDGSSSIVTGLSHWSGSTQLR